MTAPRDAAADATALAVAVAAGIGADLETSGELPPGTTARLLRLWARHVTPSAAWRLPIRTHGIPDGEL